MTSSQEQLSQHQEQEKIEKLNAQQAELKQIQIQQSLILNQQQIIQGDQKSNQEYQQVQQKQATTGIDKDNVDNSNKPKEIQKMNQQTEPDAISVQAVVISIDQRRQQQIKQQNEQAQKELEEQLQRHIEKELATGLNKIVKVTLCFVSVMIVLQTALMIAAIIARAQGTDCVS